MTGVWGLYRVKRDWVPGWLWRCFCVGNLVTFTPWKEVLTRRPTPQDGAHSDTAANRPEPLDFGEIWERRGPEELRLYKETVTKTADLPITEERPRDAGTSGAAT